MKQYVDNAKLLKALKDYKRSVNVAKRKKLPKPRVPEYIGQCLLDIAHHLSFRNNFVNYTFREEFVGEGVLTCLKYIDNFDTKKYSNPFAYFTTILYYNFLEKIKKEKRQTYIKNQIIQEVPFDTFDLQQYDTVGEGVNTYFHYLRSNNDSEYTQSVENEIKKRKEKRLKKKTKQKLEIFLEE